MGEYPGENPFGYYLLLGWEKARAFFRRKRRRLSDKELLELAVGFMDEVAYKSIAYNVEELREIGYKWLLERYGMDRAKAFEMSLAKMVKFK